MINPFHWQQVLSEEEAVVVEHVLHCSMYLHYKRKVFLYCCCCSLLPIGDLARYWML